MGQPGDGSVTHGGITVTHRGGGGGPRPGPGAATTIRPRRGGGGEKPPPSPKKSPPGPLGSPWKRLRSRSRGGGASMRVPVGSPALGGGCGLLGLGGALVPASAFAFLLLLLLPLQPRRDEAGLPSPWERRRPARKRTRQQQQQAAPLLARRRGSGRGSSNACPSVRPQGSARPGCRRCAPAPPDGLVKRLASLQPLAANAPPRKRASVNQWPGGRQAGRRSRELRAAASSPGRCRLCWPAHNKGPPTCLAKA